MNIGKLISMFVVSCLFTLSLAMGANVSAQTKGAKLRKTSEMQESSQKMSKKKPGKHHHKKPSHRHG
jgi:hypothetical protein